MALFIGYVCYNCNRARKIAAGPGNRTQDPCINRQILYHVTINAGLYIYISSS